MKEQSVCYFCRNAMNATPGAALLVPVIVWHQHGCRLVGEAAPEVEVLL